MMNMMNMQKRKALLLVPVAVLVAASAMTLGGCGRKEQVEQVREYQERNVRSPASTPITGPQDRGGGGEGGGGGGGGGGSH
jgi:uncharacterized membrane protein